MSKKLFTTLCSLFLLYNICTAQQLPLFTQYRDHAGIINPAMVHTDYLAYEYNTTIGASYRSQWTGFKNNPITQTIHADYLYSEGSGVVLNAGGYLMNDQTGPTGFTGAYAKIGGVLTDDPYYGGFSAALTVGIVQYRVNVSEINLRNPLDILPLDNQTQIYPDVGIGLFYYKKISNGWLDDDYVFGGVSVPQVFGLTMNFSDITGEFDFQRIQHIYANAGWIKFLRKNALLETTFWLKYVSNTTPVVDANLRYQMNSGLWLGIGAATSGNYHFEAGFIIAEHLRFGYGFDYSFSAFGPQAGSTHEVNLNFAFGN